MRKSQHEQMFSAIPAIADILDERTVRLHCGSVGCFDPNRSRAPTAIASLHQFAARRRTPSAPKKGRKLQDDELVHAVAVRANMRSILVAMMKSFSCSPLIFLVCRETVALPQPKLIFG